MRKFARDTLDFILSLPWCMLMMFFCYVDPFVKRYYELRKIPHTRGPEGFVQRKL